MVCDTLDSLGGPVSNGAGVLGCIDGMKDGTCDGTSEGMSDGVSDNVRVGSNVGPLDALGSSLETTVGIAERAIDGEKDIEGLMDGINERVG